MSCEEQLRDASLFWSSVWLGCALLAANAAFAAYIVNAVRYWRR